METEDTFFDKLSGMCAKELADGRRSGDDGRRAAVVESLATMLGRTICFAADGDAAAIEKMLIGCESHVANEASSLAPLVAFSAAARRHGAT